MQRLEGEVGIHGAGAVAHQQGNVVHLARLAGFDHEAALRARALAHQVVVDTRHGQHAGNGRMPRIDASIREDDDAVAISDGPAGGGTERIHRRGEPAPSTLRIVQRRQRRRAECRGVRQVPEAGHVIVVDDGCGDADLPARIRVGVEQVGLGTDRRGHRGDQGFADRVEGGIGDLCKALHEIVEEQPRARRQDGERCVRPHRTHGFLTRQRHRGQQQPQVFL